ncbi:MAG: xanthine dehydrogenase family protein molybdopterin-binding subunit [Gammaproteobacteria bacterium]
MAQQPYVGSNTRALDAAAFVSGQANYTSDYFFDGQLYAHVIRSPHAAARIKNVELGDAAKISGVVLAMDGAQAAEHLDPIPHYIDPAVFGGKTTDLRCLALNQVRYYGEPVAVVVASDKHTAQYAASRVRVDYETTAAVLDAGEAAKDSAPRVVDGWDDNFIMQMPFVGGDTDAAFEAADHVVKMNLSVHRQAAQPIETRTYNAVWDNREQAVTLYATAQNPHPLRFVLAKALRMAENRVRIVAPAIGGAFGVKMHGHPEEALVCLLAKLTKRPVKWVENREEALLIGGREQTHEIEFALNNDGRILGIRDQFLANVGAPGATPGWGMAFLTGLSMPGPYDVANVDVLARIAVTNKPPWSACRGYGKEVTALALELGIDKAARQLNMDPVELRFKNFIASDDFPKKSPTGLIYDSGDYQGAVEKTLELIDYHGFRNQQAALRQEGKYVGIGVAYEVTPEGGALPGTMVAGYDSSTVKVDPSGFVTVLTGVTDPGGGNRTGIGQIVADALGVEFETVRVVQGDTQTCPYGFGNYSGRSTMVGGGSASLAAGDVKAQIVKVAAALMEVSEDSIEIAGGIITTSTNAEAKLSFAEVCYAAYTRSYDVAACIEPPLEATRTFKPGLISHMPDENGKINPYPSYSNAAYAAVCEVDIDTGKVTLTKFAVAHDCGKAINPVLVEGQAAGAIAFGVGGMLGEEIVFDEGGGQMTTDFMNYTMPRAADLPDIQSAHHNSPNPVTFMGLKGAGEAGVGGSAAALVNAVNDALQTLGVEINELPVSAPRVWAAIQAAGEAKS